MHCGAYVWKRVLCFRRISEPCTVAACRTLISTAKHTHLNVKPKGIVFAKNMKRTKGSNSLRSCTRQTETPSPAREPHRLVCVRSAVPYAARCVCALLLIPYGRSVIQTKPWSSCSTSRPSSFWLRGVLVHSTMRPCNHCDIIKHLTHRDHRTGGALEDSERHDSF